jgi:hypothetical protein
MIKGELTKSKGYWEVIYRISETYQGTPMGSSEHRIELLPTYEEQHLKMLLEREPEVLFYEGKYQDRECAILIEPVESFGYMSGVFSREEGEREIVVDKIRAADTTADAMVILSRYISRLT